MQRITLGGTITSTDSFPGFLQALILARVQNYLYNIQAMINILSSLAIPGQQGRRKVENFEQFEKFIEQIYERNVTFLQLHLAVQQLEADLGYGKIYTVIRESLQSACKNHRSIIYSSASILAKKIHGFYKIDVSANTENQQTDKINFLQAIATVIYYHFVSISDSNQQVYELWEMIRDKFRVRNTNNSDSHIRTPELKLSILNLLALKELIPPCQYVSLSNFQQILCKLIRSKAVVSKDHLYELLNVYQSTDAIYFNDTQSLQMENGFEQMREHKQLKQKIERKEKFTIASDIDDSNWLKRAMQNPIAQKLCARLSDSFFQQVTELKKLAFNTRKIQLFDFDITQSEYMDPSGMVQKRTAKKSCQQLANELDQLSSKEQQDQQPTSRKKKRKNRNKKKKQKQQKQSQVPELNKIESTVRPSQMVNQNDFKDYIETVKFLKQLKIDDSKRVNCVIEKQRIQNWKRIVQFS